MNIILSKDLGFGAYSCQLPENHVDGVVTLVWEGNGEGKGPSRVQYGTKQVFSILPPAGYCEIPICRASWTRTKSP
jgi:hypothetical protein